MNEKTGFTIIELLVVVAIIGILASIATLTYRNAKIRARDVRRASDVRALVKTLEMYRNKSVSTTYPLSLSVLVTDGYLASEPTDPLNSGVHYAYHVYNNRSELGTCNADSTPCLYYRIGATLEDPLNTNLTFDADVPNGGLVPSDTFYGVSDQPGCAYPGSSTVDLCYDVESP